MSKIYVKVTNVNSVNRQIRSKSSDLNHIRNEISQIRYSLDNKITSRRDIGPRLNQAVTSLEELEGKLHKVYMFIDDSMNRYVEADKKVQSYGVLGKKSSWWDQIKGGLCTVGDVLKGFGKGLLDTAVSTVEGLWSVITHPVKTVKGLVHVIQHPIETGKSIWEAIKNSWNKDVVNGDLESSSHWFGLAFGEVALAVVGTKGVDKAVKLAKGSKFIKEAGGIKVVKVEAAIEADIAEDTSKVRTFSGSMDLDDAKRYKRFWDYAEHNISVEDRVKISSWGYPPSSKLYLEYKSVYDNHSYFNQLTGQTIYPGSLKGDPHIDGFFYGTFDGATIEKGTFIDRYGNNGSGRYFSPEGDSFGSRALPPFMKEAPYEVYEVIKPFKAKVGPIAPWFDEPGMGTQIFTEYMIKDKKGRDIQANVENLLRNNYIKKRL